VTDDQEQRHVAVFDCNVYLDTARILREPFTWEKFDAVSAKLQAIAVPHPSDRTFDSLRAVATTVSGSFPASGKLEVWTSSHIDMIVRSKAVQSSAHDPLADGRGLGWSKESGQALVDDLIHKLADESGGTLGRLIPDGNPPQVSSDS
jgi:hypothetical protein